MAADDKYVKVNFSIDATVGDVYFDDVVSMSATFGLNTIPTATLTVAVGKDHKRKKLATIHTERQNLKPRDPVVVYLTIIPESGNTDKVGGKNRTVYKIFEGYLSGIGYQRSHNNANYTINVVHWLDDLNNSSAVTGNWFPGSSYDLAQTAMYNTAGDKGGNGFPSPELDPNRRIVNKDNLEKDMWLNSILPIYKEIATWGNGQDQNITPAGQGKPNNAAIGPTSLGDGALLRMPGTGAPYYTPLRLNLDGLTSQDIEDSIRHSLRLDLISTFNHQTFWGKIVGEQAPQFFFAISPSVDWALPIPFFAGLRNEHKTIKADEYSYANLNASMQQMLESVSVFHPVAATLHGLGGMAPQDAASLKTPLGSFPENTAATEQGLKLYKEPPRWLTNIVQYQRMSPGTTAVGGRAIGDTASPNVGSPNSIVQTVAESYQEVKNSDITTRLATHWYKSEVLYQRYGEMSGQLRFDIAPGSIVKIETPPRDAQYGAVDRFMFATVTQVSYVINAEKAVAGTSFALAHIRTEEENNMDNYTSVLPPLFKQSWKGGPLSVPEM